MSSHVKTKEKIDMDPKYIITLTVTLLVTCVIVAGLLGLTSARDSLRGVAAQLDGIDFRLPRIDVAQRYFLDYDSIAFSATPKYSYQHPIPECRVYEHGTIYRILLGTFNTKRAVSTFRGAYPLSYLVGEDKKWCYYAGGFATREEAEAAQKLLKSKGFVRPEIVVWTDGAYRNLSRDPEAQQIAYRVEITGTEALPDVVKTVITEAAEGCELSRVGQQLFVVGMFDDKAVADRVTVLRKGKCIGTVNTCDTNKQELSNMMVGRPVQLVIDKTPAHPGEEILHVEDLCVLSHLHKRNAVDHVSFNVRAGEIVCIAGIDGNGQTELIHGLTGLDKITGGSVTLCGETITHASIRRRGRNMSHIPEDRHKHGLVLDFTLEQNMVLQRYKEPQFQHGGFIRRDAVRAYADRLIEQFDVRSGQGAVTIARSMSGGNQQKAIIAREVDRDKPLIIAVQPTRGLDVGAIEYIHKQLVAQRDAGKAVLLVSLELDEVMSLSDRILVMYEGQIVGELDPKQTTVQELGLYMSGAKRSGKDGESA